MPCFVAITSETCRANPHATAEKVVPSKGAGAGSSEGAGTGDCAFSAQARELRSPLSGGARGR